MIKEIKIQLNGISYKSAVEEWDNSCSGCSFSSNIGCVLIDNNVAPECDHNECIFVIDDSVKKYTVQEVMDCIGELYGDISFIENGNIDRINQMLEAKSDPEYKMYIALKNKFDSIFN